MRDVRHLLGVRGRVGRTCSRLLGIEGIRMTPAELALFLLELLLNFLTGGRT